MADCNENKDKQTPDMLKKAEEYLASKRRIFLWGGVDDESAERIVKQLLYLDSLNHDDIVFFINSPGGVISSGLAIYDCMNAIQSDVVTVCCGQAGRAPHCWCKGQALCMAERPHHDPPAAHSWRNCGPC